MCCPEKHGDRKKTGFADESFSRSHALHGNALPATLRAGPLVAEASKNISLNLDSPLYRNCVIPGMAAGYWPFGPGFTGGSTSHP